jgi:hypothetical protein
LARLSLRLYSGQQFQIVQCQSHVVPVELKLSWLCAGDALRQDLAFVRPICLEGPVFLQGLVFLRRAVAVAHAQVAVEHRAARPDWA